MTKKKSTKRALISSLLILAMCFTMLAGTTFAWFTDSVVSGNNIIKSGKLDVTMKWANGAEAVPAADSTEWIDASAGPIFNYDLWEPGYTDAKHIAIANEGTLALKYQVQIVANGTATELADVIDVYWADPATQAATRADVADTTKFTNVGTLAQVLAGGMNTSGHLEAGKNVAVTIVLKMQEEAGNEYQEKSIGTDFSVKLLATQYTKEVDSFDDQYDVNAEFPTVASAADATELAAALGNADVDEVVLTDDISVSGSQTISGKTIDGNGKTITVSNTGSDCGLNAKSGTIENVTVTATGFARGIGTGSSGTYAMDGDLYINNVIVDGPTYGINIGLGNGHKVVVTNSEIYGWNSMANVDASFTNCKFGKGTTNYAVFAIYTNSISFDNCEFGDPYAFYGRATSAGTITLNNCTCRGQQVTAANFATLFDNPHDSDFDYLMNQCVITVDGVRVNP